MNFFSQECSRLCRNAKKNAISLNFKQSCKKTRIFAKFYAKKIDFQIPPKMSELSSNTAKRSIRTTVFIDRSNRILESVFLHLSSIPAAQHPELIRTTLFNHLAGVKNWLTLFAGPPSHQVATDFKSGISVIVSFGPRDIGFGELYERIKQAKSSHECRIIVSQLFFEALLESQYFKKLNNTDTFEDKSKTSEMKSERSTQSKPIKKVANF